jgi:cytochrome c biogenesis protein CcmG/thiol:disulfide interchange protein DsbE
MASQENLGKVWMLNVWASWCVACRDEHPLLVQLARTGIVPIYGLNYKDERNTALQWLKRYGDPYTPLVSSILTARLGSTTVFMVFLRLM